MVMSDQSLSHKIPNGYVAADNIRKGTDMGDTDRTYTAVSLKSQIDGAQQSSQDSELVCVPT